MHKGFKPFLFLTFFPWNLRTHTNLKRSWSLKQEHLLADVTAESDISISSEGVIPLFFWPEREKTPSGSSCQ